MGTTEDWLAEWKVKTRLMTPDQRRELRARWTERAQELELEAFEREGAAEYYRVLISATEETTEDPLS